MIYVFHGDDIVAARKAFSDSKDVDSISYDAQNLSLVELAQTLQGSGLFGGDKQIFIENLFTAKAKNVEQIIELLNKASRNTEIYLFADKSLPATITKQFKNSEMKKFEVPKTIWNFVDGIRPGNPGNINLFHSALSGSEAEIVFSMIVRQFRLLLGLNSNIDEVKRLQPWQTSKLQRQLSYFGQDKVKNILKKLYKIEKQTKTGGTPLTLTQSIDMLLMQI